MLDFLTLRAIPGVEKVEEDRYVRTVRHSTSDGQELFGWISVEHNPKSQALQVSLSDALLPALPHVLTRVRHLFDLACEPQKVFEALAPMNEFKPDLCVLGTRVPGCYDAFEMSVRAILGQQITVKAASTLAGRIVTHFGTPLETEIEGLTHVFPSASELLIRNQHFQELLGPLGVISARSKTIESLATALEAGEIKLDTSSNPIEEMEKLKAIKGIGSWTAQYIAMRTMAWPDAFLETDVGVKHALAPLTPKEMLALSEAWRPWRSYATVNLWNSLTTE